MLAVSRTRQGPTGGLRFVRLLSSTVSTREAIKLVQTENIGKKAVARMALKAGTIINEFSSPVHKTPSMHTVQFDEKIHVAPTDGAEFISHGCGETNTRIIVSEDRQSARFITSTDIEKDEDLFFNYNTTEWDMDCPFVCQCPLCESTGKTTIVQGFKHMSLEERSQIAAVTSPFIRQKSREEALSHLKVLDLVDEMEDEVYYSGLSTEQAVSVAAK